MLRAAHLLWRDYAAERGVFQLPICACGTLFKAGGVRRRAVVAVAARHPLKPP
jgi:hypothetical protein